MSLNSRTHRYTAPDVEPFFLLPPPDGPQFSEAAMLPGELPVSGGMREALGTEDDWADPAKLADLPQQRRPS